MVRFGAGVTWDDVLKVVDPDKYTVIHGNVSKRLPLIVSILKAYLLQARNVGVGGYLLGVGVNPIGEVHH